VKGPGYVASSHLNKCNCASCASTSERTKCVDWVVGTCAIGLTFPYLRKGSANLGQVTYLSTSYLDHMGKNTYIGDGVRGLNERYEPYMFHEPHKSYMSQTSCLSVNVGDVGFEVKKSHEGSRSI
jgi:hypothetical protein